MDRRGEAEARAARRFGQGPTTMGPRGRVVVTLLVLLWHLNLVGALLHYTGTGGPQAAMVVFLLGLSVMAGVVILRKTWSPSSAWGRSRAQREREAARLEVELRGRPDHPSFGPRP